jgi:hypothetical protein
VVLDAFRLTKKPLSCLLDFIAITPGALHSQTRMVAGFLKMATLTDFALERAGFKWFLMVFRSLLVLHPGMTPLRTHKETP